ncbi:hypothetical protein [Pseudopedobacter saltans]|uniref:hypothetical protein n=1 Tax=Pseudopedobacter saltans TaxID=151895 RepID=UPI0003221A9D|nr:hypothetical protein [Pseudopedobacter saltans]
MITKFINNKSIAYALPKPFYFYSHPVFKQLLGLIILSLVLPYWIYRFDSTSALPDPGIIYLFLLALLFFITLLILIWKLFNSSWERLGLPDITYMVKHFKELDLWQQIILYWLSFALLLLAAIGGLTAIC